MPAVPLAAPAPREQAQSTLLLVAGLALVWGLNWAAMKFVLADIPALTFRTLCVWITGPVLLLLARLGGEHLGIVSRDWPTLLIAALGNVTLWYTCTAVGLLLIPAGRAALLAYTMPIWTALFSGLVLRERLASRRILGLAFGMAGIAILLLPEIATLSRAPLGAGLAIAAAIGWAIGTVAIKRRPFHRSVCQMTGWQLVIGGLPIVLAALLHDPAPDLLALRGTTQLVLLYIIALPMIFGQWAWFKMLDRLSGTMAAVTSFAVPVVGLVASAVLLGEPLGLVELSAVALLVGALALVGLPDGGARHRQSPATSRPAQP